MKLTQTWPMPTPKELEALDELLSHVIDGIANSLGVTGRLKTSQ